MTQRYADPKARERMSRGMCPECGRPPENHVQVDMFTVMGCGMFGLTKAGVEERIAQYRSEVSS